MSDLTDNKSSATENTAIANLDNLERIKMITIVLIHMKPKEALTLKLHYLHELSLKEIHDTTGFSISNIKTLLFRARKSFKRITESHKIDI